MSSRVGSLDWAQKRGGQLLADHPIVSRYLAKLYPLKFKSGSDVLRQPGMVIKRT